MRSIAILDRSFRHPGGEFLYAIFSFPDRAQIYRPLFISFVSVPNILVRDL